VGGLRPPRPRPRLGLLRPPRGRGAHRRGRPPGGVRRRAHAGGDGRGRALLIRTQPERWGAGGAGRCVCSGLLRCQVAERTQIRTNQPPSHLHPPGQLGVGTTEDGHAPQRVKALEVGARGRATVAREYWSGRQLTSSGCCVSRGTSKQPTPINQTNRPASSPPGARRHVHGGGRGALCGGDGRRQGLLLRLG
jgi:hypothetical protein